jgi:hypothetical protein
MGTSGQFATNDGEKTVMACVAAGSVVGYWADAAEFGMKESKRSSFPDDIDIGFTRADFVRILLGPVNLGRDALSIEQVSTLTDEFAHLAA